MFFNQRKIDYLYGTACEMLVPFYDVNASCGLPTEQGDIPPEMIKVPGGDFDGLNTYSISVKGDSMEGVGIFSGDVLLIEKICQLHNKDIIYVSVDGEWLVKTYYMDDYGRHWLVPSNPKYDPMLLTEDMDIRIGGKVKYNLTLHHENRENIMNSIQQYLQKESAPNPETPRVPTQEEVEAALVYADDKITGKRYWLGACRVLMDCKFIKEGDFQTFCNLVAYALPNHTHLPNKQELSRMAVDCFAKPFDTWTDEKAPVHGEYYKNYHRAGEAILEKLPKCLQKHPQNSHINSNSH